MPLSRPTLAAFAACLLSCAPSLGTNAATPAAGAQPAPRREEVRARLGDLLRTDAHAPLCQDIAARFAAGNQDALVDLFDYPSFVARMATHPELPAAASASLQAHPRRVEFARMHFPQDSQFICLGTRAFRGEPHVALRQWTPDRFDYVLLHLTKGEEKPIDDYVVVSGGDYQSEANALYFSPDLHAPMEALNRMLDLSYTNDFAKIIEAYRGLPPSLQSSPVAFKHFVNAVFSSERTDSPLYRQAVEQMGVVFGQRPYTLAYWKFQDGSRHDDAATREAGRSQLLGLLDDYELLGN
jgi:hypothetical protein